MIESEASLEQAVQCDCYSVIRVKNDMSYSAKLRDPRWQRKRLQIFERDNFTCCSCHKSDKTLTIHHAVYRKVDPWDYPDYLYQTLCEDCHRIRQELIDKCTEEFRVILKDVPTERLETYSKVIMSEATNVIGDSV